MKESNKTAESFSAKGEFTRVCKKKSNNSPVKMGQSFAQQVMPPSEVNWPSATSRKKTGRPPPNRKMK